MATTLRFMLRDVALQMSLKFFEIDNECCGIINFVLSLGRVIYKTVQVVSSRD
jgi:hypothetical protein